MVFVETWIHITGLCITVTVFIISMQQICISSITEETPKSIYRMMTSAMAFIEFLLHFCASLWFESSSDSLTLVIHILRFLSSLLILITFYPILIHSIQHLYEHGQFKDELKVPKWLLSPWKYMIAFTILCCVICYITTFATNSLSPLFIFYITADLVTVCGCATVCAAMFDVYFKVQETASSFKTRAPPMTHLAIHKQSTNSYDTKAITTQDSMEVLKAKDEINKGKCFLVIFIIIVSLLFLRSLYALFATIRQKDYYDTSTLNTNPFKAVFAYLTSLVFAVAYDSVLLIWCWKSSRWCRDLHHKSIAYKLCGRDELERVSTGRDEPKTEKDDQEEKTDIVVMVQDELGHTVGEQYEETELQSPREQTEILMTLRAPDVLKKGTTVTSAAAQNLLGMIRQSSADVDGLHLKCKIVIYVFDLVLTDCLASIFYRKSKVQIQAMEEAKFIKPFGGKDRLQMVQKHLLQMSEKAIVYCISSKMNVSTLEAIMQRLDLLHCFKGSIRKEVLRQLNQSTSIGDRNVSDGFTPARCESPSVAIREIQCKVSVSCVSAMTRGKSDGRHKIFNILKYEEENRTEEVKRIYEMRLFAKDSKVMTEIKGNAQINVLMCKFLECYDVFNDEILIVTPDQQTTSYFKSIGLCRGYFVKGGEGLIQQHIQEIEKYLCLC
eukprot:216781_1